MFGMEYAADPWDTSHYVLVLNAAAPLAMRSDYEGADTTAYDAYVRYLTTLLILSGKSEDEASDMAENYMTFERSLAEPGAYAETSFFLGRGGGALCLGGCLRDAAAAWL